MSSDARLYPGENGWLWTASHDGPCDHMTEHQQPASLTEKILEIEYCMGRLRWEIDQMSDEKQTLRLTGWHA